MQFRRILFSVYSVHTIVFLTHALNPSNPQETIGICGPPCLTNFPSPRRPHVVFGFHQSVFSCTPLLSPMLSPLALGLCAQSVYCLPASLSLFVCGFPRSFTLTFCLFPLVRFVCLYIFQSYSQICLSFPYLRSCFLSSMFLLVLIAFKENMLQYIQGM